VRQFVVQRGDGLEREVRMDRLGAVAGENGEVVDLARRAGLDDEPGGRAQAFAHQVLVHGRERERAGRAHRSRLTFLSERTSTLCPDRIASTLSAQSEASFASTASSPQASGQVMSSS
jgi:hypothetical protein